jgi:hypothetical protein
VTLKLASTVFHHIDVLPIDISIILSFESPWYTACRQKSVKLDSLSGGIRFQNRIQFPLGYHTSVSFSCITLHDASIEVWNSPVTCVYTRDIYSSQSFRIRSYFSTVSKSLFAPKSYFLPIRRISSALSMCNHNNNECHEKYQAPVSKHILVLCAVPSEMMHCWLD